jgi:hypothetical protein
MTELEAEVHQEVVDALAILAMHTDIIEDNLNMVENLKGQAGRCRRVLEERGEPARTTWQPAAVKPPAPTSAPPPPAPPPPVAAREPEPATMFGAAYVEDVYARRRGDVMQRAQGRRV